MNRIYLLVFNPSAGPSAAVLDFLDQRPEVVDWQAAFPHGVFVISPLDSDRLRDVIHDGTGMQWFVVTELKLDQRGTSLSGWLPKASWEFLEKYAGETWPRQPSQQKRPA